MGPLLKKVHQEMGPGKIREGGCVGRGERRLGKKKEEADSRVTNGSHLSGGQFLREKKESIKGFVSPRMAEIRFLALV